jgi:hypothetical protein
MCHNDYANSDNGRHSCNPFLSVLWLLFGGHHMTLNKACGGGHQLIELW